MASVKELLEKLSTKEAVVLTADLATELNSTKETVLKQLTREKAKGNVEGNSEEGWLITDAGKKALIKGIVEVTMMGEGVTPREKFEAIGRLIGITDDRIGLAADIVWSQNYEDLNWVWAALGQADIRDDLRKVWANTWRAFLKKGIPPELEAEFTGIPTARAGEGATGEVVGAKTTRDYLILDDMPVRVGPNLGDYTLQDAKDLLALRTLKARLTGATAPQAGVSLGGVGQEKLSDIINALQPYLQKGTDTVTLKEILGDKLELMRMEILSHIPQPGGGAQPKSLLEQLKDLKEIGPLLKSILGISETPPAPFTPAQVIGLDGQPSVMDLTKVLDLRKFLAEEKRADERHSALMGVIQTVKENVPDGIQAVISTAESLKAGSTGEPVGAKAPAPQPTIYECGECHTKFGIPNVPYEIVKCPNEKCGRVYTKEEITS